jgi:cell division protein FtsZ
VSNSAAVDANIIFGAVIDDALGDEVRVTVIAAGFDENQMGRTASGAGGLNAAAIGDPTPAPGREVPPPRPTNGTTGPVGPVSQGASAFAAPAASAARPAGSFGATPAKAGEQTMPWFAANETDTPAPGASKPVVAGSVIDDEEPSQATDAPSALSASDLAQSSPAETGAATGAPGGEDAGGPDAAASDGTGPDTSDHEAPAPAAADSGAGNGAGPDSAGPGGSAARMFDVATTRRRPVIFEEDDDLDVPDFLK